MTDTESNQPRIVPLSSISGENWDRNMSELERVCPETARQLREAHAVSTLQLEMTEDGDLLGLERDGQRLPDTFLPNQPEEMVRLARDAAAIMDDGVTVLVAYGCGLGELALLLGDLVARADTEGSVKIVGVEFDPDLIAIGMLKFGWESILESGAVMFFTGENWPADLKAWMEATGALERPESSCRLLAGRPDLPPNLTDRYLNAWESMNLRFTGQAPSGPPPEPKMP